MNSNQALCLQMKVTASELLRRLPGPVSDKWLVGERFTSAMSHGSMSVELYAPVGNDPQTPHIQDQDAASLMRRDRCTTIHGTLEQAQSEN